MVSELKYCNLIPSFLYFFFEKILADKKYDKHNFLIHDYFFGKTLDQVRPGGVIAFITSKGTMDKENPKVRRYIAQRAELLG
jgi:adenine-specific DNA methylase